MKIELVRHVDKDDTLLGVVDRLTAYKQGLIHRAAHGIVQNSRGLYLLQQRSYQKATWPGCYDLSVAETVKPQETYQSALERGLHEELAIQSVALEVVREKYYQEYFWAEYNIFGIVYLFKLESNEEPRLLDGEVERANWREAKFIDDLIFFHPDRCTPWLINDWTFYRQNTKL